VNKSPRGPLTESEVRTLLTQGVVRHNDLAYQVAVDDPKEKSDWKLLWQFNEFDRRTPENIARKKALDREMRSEVPPEVVRQQSIAELPDDLVDIAPEDRIPRARALSQAAEEQRWNLIQEHVLKAPTKFRFNFTVPRWLYGALVVVFVSYFLFRWISTKPFSTAHLTPSIPAVDVSTDEQPQHPLLPRGPKVR